MRVFFSNLGCKLNQAELERLAREFAAGGYSIVGTLAEADLHVVNSCTVTHVAARDSRKIARRGRRLNPAMKTVLTGCYVSASPAEAASLTGVDLVVTNESKENLLAEIESAFPESPATDAPEGSSDAPYMPLDVVNTRSLVKIEDGCNMPCTFCIIPKTRGSQRSRPLPEIVAEVRSLVAMGFQEIVITGVQISSYRFEGHGLFDLVTTLLAQTDVSRLRLTSIAPWQFDHRLLELFETGRLCRHFHLSLQSGCDATLQRMRRPYTAASFAALVDGVRRRVQGIAMTTDVIVGFPGETEAEFAQSLEFIERMRFARVHAFPYSPRPGTEAVLLADQVSHPEKRARMTRVLHLAAKSERSFLQEHVGTAVTVLWESQRHRRWLGMTDNYIRVTSRKRQQANTLGRARLLRIDGQGVEASPLAQTRTAAVVSPSRLQEESLRA